MFLFLPPYNRNRTIRFHAFQCFGLVIAFFLLGLVLGLIGAAFEEHAPKLAGDADTLIGFIILLSLFVFPIGATMAYCEKRLTVPVVARLAEKFA
jgi:uncharacterized membrane protein